MWQLHYSELLRILRYFACNLAKRRSHSCGTLVLTGSPPIVLLCTWGQGSECVCSTWVLLELHPNMRTYTKRFHDRQQLLQSSTFHHARWLTLSLLQHVGHLARVCQLPHPAPNAYALHEKSILLPRKKHHKSNKDASTLGTDSGPSVTFWWIVDSGSSEHMSPEVASFLDYFPIVPKTVRFGNGSTRYALGRGNVPLNTSHGPVVIKRVLYVPSLVANLLPITRTMSAGTEVYFISSCHRVYFTKNNNIICTASPKGGLVILLTEERVWTCSSSRRADTTYI